jgi:protein-S-isoprenylcysteine O-methyltransferase Ste14
MDWSVNGSVTALLGSLVFLVIAPGTAAGLVPWLVTRWRFEPALFGLEPLRWLGGLLIAAGLVVILEAFGRFAIQGLGTPAPVLPPKRLVVGGFYRHVRNPMYVAVVSLIAGQGLLFGEPWLIAYAAAVWLVFHGFVTLYEEPTLSRTYGAEYEAFRAAVPRWLPRLEPWRGGS